MRKKDSCWYYGLPLLGVLLLVPIAQFVRINWEIASRDEEALLAHYANFEVDIVDKVEWPSHETCFKIILHGPGTAERQERVAMFWGGADYDNYQFSGEYENLEQCEARFNRG